MDRKEFLKLSGMVFISSLLPFGLTGWAAGIADSSQGDLKTRKRMIVLFQRGAVDGLSLVIPYNEANYYDSRPTIAIPNPGTALGSIQLNEIFALHPSLEPILPLWKKKSLAFVQACGSPDPTRSHFDGQEYMENGTPGEKNTPDGWMNRLLSSLTQTKEQIRAVSIGATIPKILQGKATVINLTPSFSANRPKITDKPYIAKEFEELYKNDKELEEVYREGIKGREQLMLDLDEEHKIANNGAPTPKGFEGNCKRLAQVVARDPTMQIAFLDVGGWDTHVSQGSSTGQLANHLKDFGKGVTALTDGLGDAFQSTIIFVVSEFGRTLKENGHAGTDHGHGNLMWVLGGDVLGGTVYGQWPGLGKSELYEERDLSVTTDFRHILSYVVGKHFNLNERALSQIFPNTPPVSLASRNSFDKILR